MFDNKIDISIIILLINICVFTLSLLGFSSFNITLFILTVSTMWTSINLFKEIISVRDRCKK